MTGNHKKKILIISMTGGFGHIRAGEALLDFAKKHLPNVDVEHVDAITIDPSLKKYVTTIYDILSKRLPVLWKISYNFPPVFFVVKKIFALRGLHSQKIKQYILEKKPDVIICTNVVILPTLGPIARKLFPAMKIGVVVTDYYGHPYYNISLIDYYFVANTQVLGDLEKAGVAKEKIIVTGIPINPRFYIQENMPDLKLKYGIKNSFPVVVFVASFKISKDELVLAVSQLLSLEPKINLVFIANGNEEFYQVIKSNFFNEERLLLVLWTKVIEEYMKLCDVVISKAGGLTVSECISLQKPLIMVRPIPGQEEHNAKFVQENNFGVRVGQINEIATAVQKIILAPKQIPLLAQQNPSEKIFQTIIS